jgi:hypothetical protein
MLTDTIICARCQGMTSTWVLWSHCLVEELYYFCSNGCLLCWLWDHMAEGLALEGGRE